MSNLCSWAYGKEQKNWQKMDSELLDKYQDYYRVRDRKYEMFIMRQLEDEILDDYPNRF
jgi:hypothetical protein